MKLSELNEFPDLEKAFIEVMFGLIDAVKTGSIRPIRGKIDQLKVPNEFYNLMDSDDYIHSSDMSFHLVMQELIKGGVFINYSPKKQEKNAKLGLPIADIDINELCAVFEEKTNLLLH